MLKAASQKSLMLRPKMLAIIGVQFTNFNCQTLDAHLQHMTISQRNKGLQGEHCCT